MRVGNGAEGSQVVKIHEFVQKEARRTPMQGNEGRMELDGLRDFAWNLSTLEEGYRT